MSAHWILSPPIPSHLPLPLDRVSALLSRLGLPDRHAVAEELLRLLGGQLALAQCTIFSHEGQGRPRTVAVGDRSRTSALADISEAYVQRFYRLDPARPVMRAELAAAQKAPLDEPRIVLQRQRAEHIHHADYRRICYELPQVAERLAVMALFEGRRWLSVNLYRGTEHGPFDAAAVAVVEAFAPLIVHAVRLHHSGQALQNDLPELLLARLAQRVVGLTPRDHDVLRALMQGHSTEALALRLGITLASAQTYIKRCYAKLGVASQRELLGLLLQPGAPD